ncbi:PucR family transcriptional regulator [Cryptosporangium arvum]|uniref:Sugar diacid utilization regulator n=1 Tax=Cryptosporangium arvum DSM 44712 TaxID=927661 RepID=A0A010ZU08_9ACTN|nr:helix-turn-helix domain-containing protein [Cryptosporangium arvum]EXG82179.1 sugar diacid utilization regulator [Cryptosporangium arvum DSM 44712]
MPPDTPNTKVGDSEHPDNWWREQLSNLYGLFVVSMMMFDGRDPDDILRLATTSLPALCECIADTVYLRVDRALIPAHGDTPDPDLVTALLSLDGQSGPVPTKDGRWRWAMALGSPAELLGYLVVCSRSEPSSEEFFLIKALAQQTSGALASARLHQREREHATALLTLNTELQALNGRLSESVARLEAQTRVHERLGEVSASGAGEAGIALALHELTGLSAAVEDRFGNLLAWAGPDRPDPYTKVVPHRREALLRQAAAVPHPIRVQTRVISLAKPRQEVLGVIALVDPRHTAGAHEVFALEYATTVLALELSHQRSLAQAELRLRRDLVDDLIAGTDEHSAYARADALGHDLRGTHQVVVVKWSRTQTDDAVAAAAAAAAAALQLPSLISRRAGSVVLLAPGPLVGVSLHRALADKLGGTAGAVGVGGRCRGPTDVPRSYAEAVRAADVRRGSRSPDGTTSYDQLGLYRILDTGAGTGEVQAFVQEWLGELLTYDQRKSADLVHTLSQYLECGGNYDETAAALLIHRSTLRYRLGRIRNICGHDLTDVDDRLNLHVATRAWQVLRRPE